MVRQLLRLAAEHNWRLIPYGGGTSVVGHINPLAGEQPVLTMPQLPPSSDLTPRPEPFK